MEANERLKELRKALNLTQIEFAENVGLTQGYVTHLETSRRAISKKITKLICSVYNVNENWLKTGEGQIFDQEKVKNKKLTQAIEIFQDLKPEFQAYALQQIDGLLELQKKTDGTPTITKEK